MREFLKIYKDVFNRDGYPSLSSPPPPSYEIVSVGNEIPVVKLKGFDIRFSLLPVLDLTLSKEGNYYRGVLQKKGKDIEPFDDQTYFDDLTGFYWDVPGDVSTTLSWNDIDSFPSGFLLVCEKEEKLWVFSSIEDVLIHTFDLKFSLKQGDEVNNISFSPGNWVIVFSIERDFLSNMIPLNEKDSILLKEFVKISNVILGHYDFFSEYLHSSRTFSLVSNFDISSLRSMLGLDLGTDVVPYDRERILCSELPRFWRLNGSAKFLDLMRLMTGIPFSCAPLWTKDYVSFYLEDDIPSNEISLYYPTSHVSLNYPLEDVGIVTKDDVESLFYSIAPAELVLGQVVGMGEKIYGFLYFIPNNVFELVESARMILPTFTSYFSSSMDSIYVEKDIFYTEASIPIDPSIPKFSDVEILIKSYMESPSSSLAILWRHNIVSSSKVGYSVILRASGTHSVMGSNVEKGNFVFQINPGTRFLLRVQSINNIHRVKIWLEDTQEPSSWNFEFEDSGVREGYLGLSSREITWVEVHHVTSRVS